MAGMLSFPFEGDADAGPGPELRRIEAGGADPRITGIADSGWMVGNWEVGWSALHVVWQVLFSILGLSAS